MNASWPMVFGALLAGTVGGFMIPVRPEIRDVPAISASKATEPVKKSAANNGSDEVRKIPLTETAVKDSEPEAQTTAKSADRDCAKETWPYRSPNCLDRTAKVAPADIVVPARRVDPAVSLQDKDTQKTTTAASAPKATEPPAKAAEAPAPKPQPARSEQKVVTTPAPREERAEDPASQPEQASTRRPPQPEQATRHAPEPRAESSERQEAKTDRPPPRRAARRVNRDSVDLDDGIPTRIYLRGPDGRLYLAPEYRPSGRSVYIMR